MSANIDDLLVELGMDASAFDKAIYGSIKNLERANAQMAKAFDSSSHTAKQAVYGFENAKRVSGDMAKAFGSSSYAAKSLQERLKETAANAERFSAAARKVSLAATGAFVAGAAAIYKVVDAASDLQEQANVLQVSFGPEGAGQVQKWAAEVSDRVGRAQSTMQDFAGQVGAMLSPMLGIGDTSREISQDLAGLAVDLGSVFNKSDADALNAIKSALAGSSEPMRMFGVTMTEAALNAFALEHGLKQSTQEMSEAQKVALRYAFIMEKTAAFQGDAERTGGGFANMSKRVVDQLKSLSETIGKALLPYAEQFLHSLSGMLKWFQGLSPETQRFAALSIAVGTALAGVVAALTAVAAVLPAIITGFGIMASPVLLVAGAFALAVANIYIWYNVAESLVEKLKQRFTGFAEHIEGVFDGVKTTLLGILGPIGAGINMLRTASKLSGGGDDSETSGVQATVTKALEDVGKTLQDKIDSILGDPFKKLANKLDTTGDKAEKVSFTFGGMDDEVTGLQQTFEDLSLALNGFDFEGVDEEVGELKETFANLSQDLNGFDFAGETISGLEETFEELNAELNAFSTTVGTYANAQTLIGDSAIDAAGSLGLAGQVFQAAVKGFEQGGIYGAIAAVAVQLISEFENLMAVVDIGSQDIGKLIDAIDGIFEPLKDLTEASSDALSGFIDAIGEIFTAFGEIISVTTELMGPFLEIFKLLIPVIKAVATVFHGLAWVVKSIANAFLDLAIFLVRDVIGKFTDTSGDVQKLQDSKFDADGDLERAMERMWSDPFGDHATAARHAQEALDAAAEAAEEEARTAADRAGAMSEIYGEDNPIAKQAAAAAEAAAREATIATAKARGFLPEDFVDPKSAGIDQKAYEEALKKAHQEQVRAAEQARIDNLPWNQTSEAMAEFTKKLTEATGALTNVPEGVKISQARFAAIRDGRFDMGPMPGSFSAGGSVSIDKMIVQIDNWEDFIEQAKAIIAKQQAAQTGNPAGGF